MKTSSNQLDLSPLTPASRRELRDFYQFLLTRCGKKKSSGTTVAAKRTFADLCGTLSWKGDAVAAQRKIRDEW